MEITVPLYGLIVIPVIAAILILFFAKPFKRYRILTGLILWYFAAGIWVRWWYLHEWHNELAKACNNSPLESGSANAIANWITSPISTPAYWLIYKPICLLTAFIDSILI